VGSLPCFCAAAIVAAACYGQSISLGAIGGIRTTDDLTYAASASKRYVVGPAIEFSLPRGFAVEADALYRREGYLQFLRLFPIGGYGYAGERANSWEFPLLAKYALPRLRGMRAFVEAGYAPRIGHGTVVSDEVYYDPYQLPLQWYYSHAVQKLDWPVSHGFVTGGGVSFRLGRLRLAPTVRYTHWSNAAPLPDSAQNQVDVLLGIGMQLRR
jgi:hypothetical protein